MLRELPGLAVIVDASASRRVCSSWLTSSQYLSRITPESMMACSTIGNQLKEPGRLLLGAKPHDRLDPGAVVPASIEDHDLASGGQVGDVALHVHLRAFPVIGSGEGHDPEDPGADPLGEPFDDTALPRRVTALEHDAHLGLPVHDPALQVHELDLQTLELLLVLLASHLACWHRSAISPHAVGGLAFTDRQPVDHRDAEARRDE